MLFQKTGFIAVSLFSMVSCHQKTMSIIIQDDTLGSNGSFEYSKNGLPVNWQLYTAQTAPSGDFDILLDTQEVKNGKQSLKFMVRACDTTGGWYSPGIAQQIAARPGETYKVSFWVKNNGGRFIAKIAGISATTGQSEVIVDSTVPLNDWTLFEHSYVIPPKMNALRFELNMLSEGTLWVDDFRLKRL